MSSFRLRKPNLENKFDPTNIPGLVKDKNTNVILNTNLGEYQRVLALREKKKEDNKLKSDIDTLKEEISSLKDVVADLVQILRK